MQATEIQSVNDLGLELLTRCAASLPGSVSLLLSPFSITVAMAMLAGTAGPEQRQELCLKMGISDPASLDKAVVSWHTLFEKELSDIVHPANAAFLIDKFIVKDRFREFLKSFSAQIGTFPDLADASDEINSWIADSTMNMIQNMLSKEILSMAEGVLINALAFKGRWATQFNPQNTLKDYPFQQGPNQMSKVNMMFLYNSFVDVADHQDCTVIRLPFQRPEGKVAVFFEVYIPQTGKTFQQMALNIRSTPPLFVKRKLERLGLPRIAVKYKADVTDILQTIGFPLHGGWPEVLIGAPKGPRFDVILHETAMELDEEGVTAVAATVVAGVFGAAPPPRSIILDRPFIFTISTGTNINLFTGLFNG